MAKQEKDIFASDQDSEDDEDYVPPEDKKESKNPDASQNEKDADSSEGITGVEAIKREKRKREVDDFFDEMTKEDPLLKQM